MCVLEMNSLQCKAVVSWRVLAATESGRCNEAVDGSHEKPFLRLAGAMNEMYADIISYI